MVLRDVLILLFVSECTVLVRFGHTSCFTGNILAKCDSVTELSDSFFNRSVENFQDVSILIVENNYTELIVYASAFRYSKNLESIAIRCTRIRRIFEGTFRDLPLVTLNIYDNGVEEIYPGAFYNLSSLLYLDVRRNRLKTIPRGVFKDLPKLKFLTLDANEISTIEDFALENLPELETLRLESNKIETIVIHKVVSHPDTLKKLGLRNNSLSSVTRFMLKQLTSLAFLHLEINQISMIEANAFEQTPKLNILTLSHNKLKVVDGIFSSRGLYNLYTLELDNNELMFLTPSFLFGLNSLVKITLYENPWKCACLDSIRRILTDKGIHNRWQGAYYSTGKRPLCVSRDASNKYCSFSYDSELREIYMNYTKTYPVREKVYFLSSHCWKKNVEITKNKQPRNSTSTFG